MKVCLGFLLACLYLYICNVSYSREDDRESIKHDSLLRYPLQVKLPDDLPSFAYTVVKRGSSESPRLFLPISVFASARLEGWQQALRDFAESDKDPELLGKPTQPQTVEPYTGRGLEDGYLACKARLLALKSKHSSDELRQLARRGMLPFSLGGQAPEPDSK